MSASTAVLHAVIFDFDGLILDTETSLVEAWRAAYIRAGVEFPESLFHDAVGSADEPFDPMEPLRAMGLAETALADVAAQVRVHHRQMVAAQPLLPGVAALIAEVRSGAIPLAIASNSPHVWVDRHLRTHELFPAFAAVCCRDDVATPKPAPEIYALACSRLGVAPENALALEDSARGVAAAVAAGTRCVAVPGPTTRDQDFRQAHAFFPSLAGVNLARLAQAIGLTVG